MEVGSNVYRQWKPGKRVKLGKLCQKLKPAKLFKALRPLFRMLFPAPAAVPQPSKEDNLAFMTFTIKVNSSKPGWQKAVLAVLKNCQGARFKMDEDGVVEISGIADPKKLLKKLGRSKEVEVRWFQFGQCSSNLFMPKPKKNPVPDYVYYNPPYDSLPPYRGGYGYGYGPPQVFGQYAPPY